MKIRGSTPELLLKLWSWSAGEVSGIPSVAVKCVDLRRNTGGESDGIGLGVFQGDQGHNQVDLGGFGQFLVGDARDIVPIREAVADK